MKKALISGLALLLILVNSVIPAYGSSNILFMDDFSNGIDSWNVDTTHGYKDLWEIDNSGGNEKLMWPSEYYTGSVYTGDDNWCDYTAEISYTHTFYDTATNVWQISFAAGYTDRDNAYWLTWQTDSISIANVQDGVWRGLTKVKTELKPAVNKTYKLKVVSVNNILQLYINDEIAAQAYTDEKVVGKVALLASNIVGAFDDFSVRKTDCVSDIVFDNSDADSFECAGNWNSDKTGGHYIKDDYLVSKGVSDYKSSYAKWKLKLPQKGYYQVYMMWYPNTWRPPKAELEICYDGNVIDSTKYVNQTRSDGWNNIGTYYFNGGGDEYIKLYSSSVPSEYSAADAVLLHYIGSDISDNAYLNSSSEYMFEVKDSNEKFLYLDEYDSASCIIMPIGYFEPKEFDKNGSVKMNVNDSENIAHYLNSKIKAQLPQSILNHIDETGFRDDYSNTMGISLLSQDEYARYADKIGICDSLPSRNENISGWWLRTQDESQTDNIKYVSFDNLTGRIEIPSGKPDSISGVRPVICISKSFFEDDLINIDTAGNYVKKKAGYNGNAVFMVNCSFTNYDGNYVGTSSNLDSNRNVRMNAVLVNQGNAEKTLSLFCGKYTDGTLTAITPIQKVLLKEGERKEVSFDCGYCGSNEELKGFCWSDIKPISKVLKPTEPTCYKAAINANDNYNVFLSGDAVEFEIETDNDKVIYEAEDYFGNKVLAEEVNISEDNKPVFNVGNGYYELYVKSKRGKVLSKTSFAVIDEYDFKSTADSDFGICTHFADKRPEWDFGTFKNLYLMGAKNIRDGCDWFTAEKTKGNVSVNAEPFKSLIEQYNINFLFVTGYINRFYDNNMTPYTAEGYEGFANYVDKAAGQYGSKLKYIDIYNEFYGKYGKMNGSPAGSLAEYYYPLLDTAYKKVKASYPDIMCLSNAVIGYNNWFDTLLTSMEEDNNYCCDGFYCHPYFNGGAPEQVLNRYISDVKGNIESHVNDTNNEKKIWITETGANTVNVSEKDQARYVPRAYAISKSLDVEKVFWYDYIDDGTDTRNTENYYGFVRNGNSELGAFVPKPSYVAYCVMTRKLTGAEFVKLDVTEGVYKAEFDRNGSKVYLIWAAEPCGTVFDTDKSVKVTDIVGKTSVSDPVQGKVSLNISEDIIYIEEM